MYSNFPPSLPSCWEKDYVVRLKRTRKKQLFSSSIRGSRQNMRDEDTNNPSDDNEYKEVNLGKRKSFFFCGHLDATINKMSMYNIISFALIFFIVCEDMACSSWSWVSIKPLCFAIYCEIKRVKQRLKSWFFIF